MFENFNLNNWSARHPAATLDLVSADPPEKTQYEFLIGLVGPIGTDFERVGQLLTEQVSRYEYKANVIRLSALLSEPEVKEKYGLELQTSPEYDRVKSHMLAGDEFRKQSGTNEALALYAAAKILQSREKDETTRELKPRLGTVHLLVSLKHPAEVAALRRIYGAGFILIGVHCLPAERQRYLRERKHMDETQIAWVIEHDEHEKESWGQRTRETFEQSDFFLDYSIDDRALQKELARLVALLFGSPYITPSVHEHAMFMAYAASFRSGSLARQVGAAVSSKEGDILATGANDAPRYGGGQYWPGEEDRRDLVRGNDANDTEKTALGVRVLQAILPASERDGVAPEELYKRHRSALKASGLLDLTEYGRDVHAEMEAISCCARNGIRTRDATLYTTTFPCHNCAKHIVGAGIREVYYVEPYPKSRALQLHDDAIELVEPAQRQALAGRVAFRPFVGVGPRRYLDLFSINLGFGRALERKRDGDVIPESEWSRLGPRIPMPFHSYMDLERLAANQVLQLLAGSASVVQEPGDVT